MADNDNSTTESYEMEEAGMPDSYDIQVGDEDQVGEEQVTEEENFENQEDDQVEKEDSPDDQWSGDYGKLKDSYENLRVYANRLKQESDLQNQSLQSQIDKINSGGEDLPPNRKFENKVKEDPYAAVRDVALDATSETAQRLQRIEQQQAILTFERAKNDLRAKYPEYDEMEPLMAHMAQTGEFAHLINPANANDPTYLKFMFLEARERSKGGLTQRAMAKGRQEVKETQAKKKRAFVESSSKPTSSSKKFKDLSVEEMEKELGFASNKMSSF